MYYISDIIISFFSLLIFLPILINMLAIFFIILCDCIERIENFIYRIFRFFDRFKCNYLNRILYTYNTNMTI